MPSKLPAPEAGTAEHAGPKLLDAPVFAEAAVVAGLGAAVVVVGAGLAAGLVGVLAKRCHRSVVDLTQHYVGWL
jgi:phosphoribosylcarboxyaminoimidazole (NCAIR) mutase